jgi:hypothetical protein
MKRSRKDKFVPKFGSILTIYHFALITIIYPHEITRHNLHQLFCVLTIVCIGL